MAFNWQTFKTRALTAIFFVVVMMAGLLWNKWSFFILFSVVHFGAWWEYQKLASKINAEYALVGTAYKVCLMIAGWCLLLFFTNQQLHIAGIHFTSIGWWLGLALLVIVPLMLVWQSPLNYYFKNIAHSLFGIFYISLSIGLLMDLRTRWSGENADLNLIIPLLIIFTLWVNDTMAYIVGSLFGKTPFSPISPKKTWEGTIGGVVLAVMVMWLAAYFTKKLPVTHAAVIALLSSVAGTYGDLFESKLKRLAGVKDSGHIMPGHGGFLDRFDSLLFAVTVVWFYVVLFM